MVRKDDEVRSLCIALKAIWDKRVEKGELTITRNKEGQRVITIR